MDENNYIDIYNSTYYSNVYRGCSIQQDAIEATSISAQPISNETGSVTATTAATSTIGQSTCNYISYNAVSRWSAPWIHGDYEIRGIDYGYNDHSTVNTWYNIGSYINYPCNLYTIEQKIDPIVQKRIKIRNNLNIIVNSRAQNLRDIPENEWIAMQTLREMITESAYRKYIRDGFITVQGQSGKIYQIFRNRNHHKVYYKGELFEEICVRLKGDVPPTDNVIAFKTMIEVDEESFAILGNRYNMRKAA
jgi:hypothetical protein